MNLKKRPDRLAESLEECRRVGIQPQVFEAVDGSTVEIPPVWKEGAGAWGCRLSHMSVLADAIEKQREQICILEDDVTFVPNFQEKLADFLAEVPTDWDAIMLGGQHCGAPEYISESVFRCICCHRSHTIVVRGAFLRTLHGIYSSGNHHIDWNFANIQKDYRVYCPTTWLVGQRASTSDITGMSTVSDRWWMPRRAVAKKVR
ncbi:glycosyltransferase family 25 protein [Gemmata massiliana]|uniref:glycosyltransferase family 25 protein n=1 Tax=Gemmata massiliana TaxID=1210884 RepID=UPI0036F366E1